MGVARAVRQGAASPDRGRTHEPVDPRVFFQDEVEGERGEEDDRLHVVKVRDPVLSLRARPRATLDGRTIAVREAYTAAAAADVVDVPFRAW